MITERAERDLRLLLFNKQTPALSEGEMVRRLGVSRVVVRGAVAPLKAAGILKGSAGMIYRHGIEYAEATDLSDLRMVLETDIIRKLQARSRKLGLVQDAMVQVEDEAAIGNVPEYLVALRNLHVAIAIRSGGPLMAHTIGAILDGVYVVSSKADWTRSHFSESSRIHADLVSSIVGSDIQGAITALGESVRFDKDQVAAAGAIA
jgi:DNA-binding GntR family transcriptional regulator